MEGLLIKECAFAGIDFESSGVRPGDTEQPVQIGIASMRGLEIERADFFQSFLKVEHRITPAAQRVHGISDSDLEEAPTFLSLWGTLKERLQGRVLVAYGAGTERRYLRAFPGHSFGPWVDVLPLVRAALPKLERYSLENVACVLGLEEKVKALCPEGRWHEALFDSVGALVVLQYLIVKLEMQNSQLEALLHPDTTAYYSRL